MAVVRETAQQWGEHAPTDALGSWFAERFPTVPIEYPPTSLKIHVSEVTSMISVYDGMNSLEQMSTRLSLGSNMRQPNRPDQLYDAVLFGTLIESAEAADACADLIDEGRLPDRSGPLDVKIWGIGLVGNRADDERIARRMKKWFDDESFDGRYKGQIAVDLAEAHPEIVQELLIPLIVLADKDDGTVKAEFVFASLQHSVGQKQYNELLLGLPPEYREMYIKLCQFYKLPRIMFGGEDTPSVFQTHVTLYRRNNRHPAFKMKRFHAEPHKNDSGTM